MGCRARLMARHAIGALLVAAAFASAVPLDAQVEPVVAVSDNDSFITDLNIDVDDVQGESLVEVLTAAGWTLWELDEGVACIDTDWLSARTTDQLDAWKQVSSLLETSTNEPTKVAELPASLQPIVENHIRMIAWAYGTQSHLPSGAIQNAEILFEVGGKLTSGQDSTYFRPLSARNDSQEAVDLRQAVPSMRNEHPGRESDSLFMLQSNTGPSLVHPLQIEVLERLEAEFEQYAELRNAHQLELVNELLEQAGKPYQLDLNIDSAEMSQALWEDIELMFSRGWSLGESRFESFRQSSSIQFRPEIKLRLTFIQEDGTRHGVVMPFLDDGIRFR
jgi:hypothetical protein